MIGDVPSATAILDRFLHHAEVVASTALAKQLQSGAAGDETVAAHLAMAIMADADDRKEDAIRYYEKARDQLLALRVEEPQRPQIERSLADCYTALARLVGNDDRAAARDYLTAARDIRRQLANAHPTDALYQFAWMESETDCATLLGGEEGKAHLLQSAQIEQTLRANWPTDSAAVYALACFLTRREPILSNVSAVSAAAP